MMMTRALALISRQSFGHIIRKKHHRRRTHLSWRVAKTMSFLPYERPSTRDHHRDMENDRWSLYAYEDALLPGHDPV